jgi:hypothetical protein
VKGTVKETTYSNYTYITRKHVSPALGHVKLKSLTPAHVRGFYGEKARTNLSAATVKKMHIVLRKALSQAVRTRNPLALSAARSRNGSGAGPRQWPEQCADPPTCPRLV